MSSKYKLIGTDNQQLETSILFTFVWESTGRSSEVSEDLRTGDPCKEPTRLCRKACLANLELAAENERAFPSKVEGAGADWPL